MKDVINTTMIGAIEQEATRLEPKPAEDTRPRAMAFPLESLPAGWQWIIEHLYQTLRFPVDYTAAAMLFAACVAIGTSARVMPKRGWYEYAILWIMLIGRPGVNKSHPGKWALAPLRRRDKSKIDEYDEAMRQYEQEVYDIKNTKIAKGEKRRELPKEPECPQCLMGDFTPESLVEAMNRNTRGIGVCRDELEGLFKDFGKYHSGGDVQALLSMWSAQPVIVNRVKFKRPVFIDRSFLPMFGTTQPGVLGSLEEDGRGENGFRDRWAPVYPEAQHMPEWTMEQVDPEVQEYWEQYIGRLFSVPETDPDGHPLTLPLSEGAMDVWIEHHAWMKAEVDRLNDQGDERRAGQRTKMLIYTLRLALVHCLATWAESGDFSLPKDIPTASMKAAVTLSKYFISCADKVLYTLHEGSATDKLKGDNLKLYEALPDAFTTAEGRAILEAHPHNLTTDQVKKRLRRWVRDKVLGSPKHGQYVKP